MSIVKSSIGKPRQPRRWRSKNGLLVPTGEAVAEALAEIPEGPPWAWAALRVLPSIRGTRVPLIDTEEFEDMGFEPLTNFPSVEMAPGIAVTCAIEADVVAMHVGQPHLDRWDKTIDDVMVAAMANLRRTVARWTAKIYEDTSLDGTVIRQLERWPHWAITLLLLPDELKRIFGKQDQLLIAPYHCLLMSLPIDVDREFAADLIDMFGTINPRSLLLGLPAFVLRDGNLTTEELPGYVDDPREDDDEDWSESGRHRLSDLLGW